MSPLGFFTRLKQPLREGVRTGLREALVIQRCHAPRSTWNDDGGLGEFIVEYAPGWSSRFAMPGTATRVVPPPTGDAVFHVKRWRGLG
ncbi:hypothetical protein [Myxococcus sp. CA040A]|uniref:hypothetical protein n=1 Tax=Myxococcus sp. CA040A TaxID=2741738 RepID=UPI00157AD5C2|nr:hypothetical protein [Myxococcus sp. CA040A]NTX05969.1 hypothetical protein [Myxococcus sp. CA040A]